MREILECDLQLEQAALPALREGDRAIAKACAISCRATCSAEILEGEEDHVDFLETQLELIDKIGIENYIQLQSGAAE